MMENKLEKCEFCLKPITPDNRFDDKPHGDNFHSGCKSCIKLYFKFLETYNQYLETIGEANQKKNVQALFRSLIHEGFIDPKASL